MTGQPAGRNQPGLPDIDPQEGLITLLRRTFRSSTHVQEARQRLMNMKFDSRGKEGIEAFGAKMLSEFAIIGLNYDPYSDAINGTRASYLFAALPSWLSSKIQEQGIPSRCDHQEWCFGRVITRARIILAANKPKIESGKKEESTNSKKDYKPSEKKPFNKEFKKNSKPFIPSKKLSDMTSEERLKLRKEGACFFCKKKGHTIAECPEKAKKEKDSITLSNIEKDTEEEEPVFTTVGFLNNL